MLTTEADHLDLKRCEWEEGWTSLLLVETMWLFSFIEWNQWIEVEALTNTVKCLTTNEGKEGGRHKRKGFGARTNTAARAVNSPESCISRGVMEGWSPANTNTGLAREDLHRWARFPPFQIPSPVVPSAICCPPPHPPAAVNSWVCHSLEPLIMSNQSLLYLFIYLYTVWSQVSSLRRRLLPSKHAQRFDAEVWRRGSREVLLQDWILHWTSSGDSAQYWNCLSYHKKKFKPFHFGILLASKWHTFFGSPARYALY